MARPRDAEKARDLALRASAILQEQGLGISTERLAQLLDVKRPTLLYHFPTQTSIVEAALAELFVEQAAFVERKVGEHEHPIDRVYARMRAVHEFHRGQEARLLFLTQSIAVSGGTRALEILRGASDFFEPGRRAMVDGIERGVAEGTVAPCDAKALVNLVRAVIDGLTIQAVTSSRSVKPIHELVWKSVLEPLKIRRSS